MHTIFHHMPAQENHRHHKAQADAGTEKGPQNKC
jgi:hypothetical protein